MLNELKYCQRTSCFFNELCFNNKKLQDSVSEADVFV